MVGGFLAEVRQWAEFERNWREVLDRFKVSKLHMRQFAHSLGEFAAWKGDEETRQFFLRALISTIQLRVRHSFAQAVIVKDFERIDVDYKLSEYYSPFSLVGYTAFRKVERWAKRYGVPLENVMCYFEGGDQDQKSLKKVFEQQKRPRVQFLSKSATVAFQAADLLAYEYLRTNRELNKTGPNVLEMADFRKPFRALSEIPNGRGGDDWGVFDDESLRDAVNEGLLEPRACGWAGKQDETC